MPLSDLVVDFIKEKKTLTKEILDGLR